MKKVNRVSFGLIALFSAGFVLACSTLQFPPMRIAVSLWDIAVATWQGHPNPAFAAFMANVDDAGEEAFGAEVWHANNYVGSALLTTSVLGMTSGQIVNIDKPCDKNAVDSLPPTRSNNSGSSGGNTGPGGASGGRVGVVGYSPVYDYTSVCTLDGCTLKLIVVGYRPIYGNVNETL